MRKILFVIPSLAYSGAARQLTLLAGALPRDRFDVRVAVLGGPSPWADELRAAKVSVDVLGRRRAFDVRPLLGLGAVARELRPQVVHAWGPAALRAVTLVPGARGGGKLVLSAALPPAGPPSWADRLLMRRAQRVVCFGAGEAARYEALGVRADRIVRTRPATAAMSESAPCALDGVAPDAPVVLVVGPFHAHKGLREAVWALDVLRYVYPNLHLVAVGQGPERPRVEAFARNVEVSSQVHMIGPVDDLRPYLARADVVWVPSLADCGSSNALEAMAAGRPVVASRWPGLVEVIEDGQTGFLVAPDDKAALARQTRLLLDEPALRRRLGEAGRHRVAQFSVLALASACASVYERVASD